MPSATASSPRLLPTAGLVSLLVLLLSATALFALSYSHAKSAAALERIGLLRQAQVDAVKVQVNFKTQVQEWKDVLLRGHGPADYAAYWSDFEQRETAVRDGLMALQAELAGLGLDASGPKRLVEAHAALGAAYRKAIAGYQRSERDSTFAVDASVRGIDRQLNQDIDALAQTMHVESEKELKAFFERGEASYAALRKIVLGLAGLTVLVAFWLVFQTARSTTAAARDA
ncbi:MAG TPA: hypothetical protein VG710_16885 [Opitutus sp.]|nr:hypothetical protein [Opitutus sp.]